MLFTKKKTFTYNDIGAVSCKPSPWFGVYWSWPAVDLLRVLIGQDTLWTFHLAPFIKIKGPREFCFP